MQSLFGVKHLQQTSNAFKVPSHLVLRNCAYGDNCMLLDLTEVCLYLARALTRNLQVATAGEDEEDLRVVDGQQRTARRDDEHGCALNTTGSALSRSKKRPEEIVIIKKRGQQVDPCI